MQSKMRMATGAALLTLMLIGGAPALAASQNSTQVTVLVQLATAAQSYANNLLSIAQKSGVSDSQVSQAQTLIGYGDKNLTAGKSASTTDIAIHDAVIAMRDFRDAARLLQAQLVDVVHDANQAGELTEAIEVHLARAAKLETLLTNPKVCNTEPANGYPAGSACLKADIDLDNAVMDLNAAKAALASKDMATAIKDFTAAVKLLGDTRSDIAKIAAEMRSDRAVDFVQNLLSKRVAEVQTLINSLPSATTQQQAFKAKVQGELNTVMSDLNTALTDFKSGNPTQFKAGIDLVQQAVQLLHQIVTEIRSAHA